MKVYISKSNHASIDDLLEVRTMVEKEGHTTLEFTGGNYDPKLIERADLIICIPPRSSVHDDHIRFGRGIGSEVVGAKERGQKTVIYDYSSKKYLSPEEITKSEHEDWKFDFYRCTKWNDVKQRELFDTTQKGDDMPQDSPLKRILPNQDELDEI